LIFAQNERPTICELERLKNISWTSLATTACYLAAVENWLAC